MARLSLSLLGGFQTALDGEPITRFRSAKVRALLAYLAVEADRPHSRETLAGLLWPESPEPLARSNLRRALAALRKAIGDSSADPSHLLITRETIQFDRASDCRLDVQAFQTLVRAREDADLLSRLEEAVSLYRGAFLDGFSLKDSPAFEDWALLTREHLQRQMLDVLRGLADRHEERGAYARACEFARRQVALEPWQEEGHRQVMHLLALRGQRGAALAQYEACRRALAEELNVEPAAETTALYERVRSGTLAEEPERGRAAAIGRPDTDKRAGDLPVPLTPLIGREEKLAEVKQMLRDPACRLLALVGPGGIGKTHLALAAARELVGPHAGPAKQGGLFADGVAFVSLGPLQDADAIVPAIARALGFGFYAGAGPRQGAPAKQQLCDYLRQRRVLLVLDSMEHLLDPSQPENADGASLVADLLTSAPGVRVLVTSRVGLGLPGEYLFRVPPLSFPAEWLDRQGARSLASRAPAGEILEHSAVQLYLASARRVKQGFEPLGADLLYVAEICQLVQGIPLGILLAASWAGVLPSAEIAAQIRSSFDFLTTHWRGVPARQRSMRAVMNHSWSLLAKREREVMQALSVFRGGFTGEAAHAIAGASMHELRSLVDRSLVQVEDGGRYDMHELLRQYAAERLGQRPAASQAARDRHAAYYAAALHEWAEDLRGPRQREALTEMDLEIDNASAAWGWARERHDVERLCQAAGGLGQYYERRRRAREGEAVFASAVERLQAAGGMEVGARAGTLRLLARLLGFQAWFAFSSDRTWVASDLLAQGLALVEKSELQGQDVRTEEAYLWWVQGWLGRTTGRGEIKRAFERSLALYRAARDRAGVARALCDLGRVNFVAGDYGEATSNLAESASICRALGDARGLAEAILWLGWVRGSEGRLEDSERLTRESLATGRELGDAAMTAEGLTGLAFAFAWAGRYADSLRLAEERLAIYQDLGVNDSYGLVWVGWDELQLGRYEEAGAHLRAALNIAQDTDNLFVEMFAGLELGRLAVCSGTLAEARRLFLESITGYEEVGFRDWEVHARCALAYAVQGPDDLERARRNVVQALQWAAERGSYPVLVEVLPAAALLFLEQDEVDRAVNIYELACTFPAVANSCWTQDVVGQPIAQAAANLAPAVVAAARERGRARDVQATLQELIAEWGE